MNFLKKFELIQDHLEMIPRHPEHEKNMILDGLEPSGTFKILKKLKIRKTQKMIKKTESSEETIAESDAISIFN